MALSLPRPAAAEPASGEAPSQQRYVESVREAINEFSVGNYAEARALFLQAHEINPNARTLRGLAKVEFELRNYHRCLEYIEASLASEVRPLTPAMREDLEQLRQRARAFVSTVEFKVSPGNARVRIDGTEHKLSGSGTLQLSVGEHVAVIDAPGHQSTRMQLEVAGGQTRVVEVSLVPLVSPEQKERLGAGAPEPGPLAETSRRRRRWAWALAAVAVAAGAAVGAGIALSDRDEATPSGGDSGIVLTLPPLGAR